MSGVDITLTALGLFIGMLSFMEIGRQIGRFRIQKHSTDSGGSFAALEASVFGLMGLLIAFTFSVASSRFEMRRQLTVAETNNIATAWRRLNLLPDSRRSALRESFRRYVDSRIDFYQNLNNAEEVAQILSRTKVIQDEIWSNSVTACREIPSPAITSLVVASVDAMIEIANTRAMAARTHLPSVIRIQLFVLPLICALLAGLNSAPSRWRSWARILLFPLMVSVTVFVILDLDYPRVGLIRLDMFDQMLIELRNGMQAKI